MLLCSPVEQVLEKAYITIHDILTSAKQVLGKMRKKIELEASGGNQNLEFEPLLEDPALCAALVNRRQI